MKKVFFWGLGLFLLCLSLSSQAQLESTILPGAYQTAEYLPWLKNKKVGVFTNHTALINQRHLIDTLLSAGITVQKIFTPEHGLRGTADAGEITKDGIDSRTGIPTGPLSDPSIRSSERAGPGYCFLRLSRFLTIISGDHRIDDVTSFQIGGPGPSIATDLEARQASGRSIPEGGGSQKVRCSQDDRSP